MSFPTSRKYPRTLKEAFPQDDIEWFEPHQKKPCYWCIPAWLLAISVASYLLMK